MKSVLFVCTGNTCRSPMAEGIFKDMLRKKDSLDEDIKIQSAGIFALEGDGASDQAVEVMKEMGIDIKSHRAQRLTPSMIRDADIIFAMTKNHRDAILSIDPSAGDKVHIMAVYAAKLDKSLNNIEIDDPYGQSVERYRESAEKIKKVLDIITDDIK